MFTFTLSLLRELNHLYMPNVQVGKSQVHGSLGKLEGECEGL